MKTVRHTICLGFSLFLFAMRAAGESPTCLESDIGRVAITADGLRLTDSATQGLHAGDVLVQLNSHLLHNCADLTGALSEARAHQLARLFLVRRERGLEAVALQSTTAVAVAPAAAPVIQAAGPAPMPAVVSTPVQVVVPTPTPVAEPTPTPVTIGTSDVGAVRATLNELQEFGKTLRASLPVVTAQPWAREVSDLQRVYERRRAETPSTQALAPILAYYQSIADILVYKDKVSAERAAHEMGQKRPQPNAVFEYHSGTPVSGWLQHYPFLQVSVIDAPETTKFVGWGEGNGTWVPDRAIELLVEHALADGDALGQRLDSHQER